MSLVIANDFDFQSNKVIPRVDPTNPTKVTTSMLAFGEPIWEPRARLYLEKGIVKMKDKDWKSIMKAIADIAGTSLKKRSYAPVTEEEAELSWESESE